MRTLQTAWLDTPLGPIVAIADEKALYVLEFIDEKNLEQQMAHLSRKTHSTFISGITTPIRSIEKELNQYFKNGLTKFSTPLAPLGTPFQKSVWHELQKIPHGKTASYAQIAQALQKPTAYRAVAQANRRNPISILIPCHRVINSNGCLGGYAGGIPRKEWLLKHEQL